MFLKLYALRVGLCQLIDNGELDETKAVDLFEIARDEAVEQRRREDRLLTGNKGGQPL